MPRTKGSLNTKPRRVLVAARLPEEIAAYLRPNVTEKLERIVRSKMDERETKRKQAEKRINGFLFTADELDTIWADWPNIDEHYDWLLTASRAEIIDWIDAQK